MLSPAYHQAVAEASDHHASSKTYSGLFLRPHAAAVKELINRLGVTSILDYGCGKGRQYEWVSHDSETGVPVGQTLEEFFGIRVAKFDPCWGPFARPPDPGSRFDLVLCTHVLGSVPLADLQIVKWMVYRYAHKAVYIAEKLGPVGKAVFSAAAAMPRGWDHEQWADALRPTGRPSLEVWLTTRDADRDPLLKRTRVLG